MKVFNPNDKAWIFEEHAYTWQGSSCKMIQCDILEISSCGNFAGIKYEYQVKDDAVYVHHRAVRTDVLISLDEYQNMLESTTFRKNDMILDLKTNNCYFVVKENKDTIRVLDTSTGNRLTVWKSATILISRGQTKKCHK